MIDTILFPEVGREIVPHGCVDEKRLSKNGVFRPNAMYGPSMK